MREGVIVELNRFGVVACKYLARCSRTFVGTWLRMYSADVVPGDILILDLGKRISADVRLIETQDFLCGEMALTGKPQTLHVALHAISHRLTQTLRFPMIYRRV